MYVKFVSEIDYGYNQETGEWNVPMVEWETELGRFRERFESEEARTQALDENEAYNNLPEVKAFIEEMEEADDKWRAEAYTSQLFEWALERNQTVAFGEAVSFSGYCNARVKKFIAKLVCQHNKLIMKARVQPAPATNLLGDFF